MIKYFSVDYWFLFPFLIQFEYNYWIWFLIVEVISMLDHPFLLLLPSRYRFYFRVVRFWVIFICLLLLVYFLCFYVEAISVVWVGLFIMLGIVSLCLIVLGSLSCNWFVCRRRITLLYLIFCIDTDILIDFYCRLYFIIIWLLFVAWFGQYSES